MKAKIKMLLPGFTGNMDDVVIYYNSKLNCYVTRRKVTPKKSVSTKRTSEIYKFAKRINLSQAWKDDCDAYIRAYNAYYRKQGRALVSWPSVWMKMMSAQLKASPELNITELTREEVLEQNLPCRSISAAIDAGFLANVKDSGRFTQLI